MRVKLLTLGCRVNEAETEAWARDLHAQGHRLCTPGEAADLVVVNTCAVTREALRKSGQMLRRCRREDPQARLVVSGCAVSLPGSLIGSAPGLSQTANLVIPNADKDRLVDEASRYLGTPGGPGPAVQVDTASLMARSRQRAFLKVQDGCRHRCAYCVTTLARGEERSRPTQDVVAEVRTLTALGIDEVLLTGVHLGGYGSDRAGEDLISLIRALLAETPIRRLRLGSLEPWAIPEGPQAGFWDLFGTGRLLPHLHLPIQSGSDTVLRRMARRGRARDLLALVGAGRGAVADLNLTTDIIAGYPGESEAEWQETIDLVERIGFGGVHVFAFSAHPGTRAAGLPDQVPVEVRQQRARQLRRIAAGLRSRALTRLVGRCVEVLVEGGDGPVAPSAPRLGYTPSYLPVRIRGLSSPIGPGARIRRVRLTGVSADGEALEAIED